MNPFKLKSGYLFYWHSLKAIFTHKQFVGWGRKRTGRFAGWCAKTFNGQCTLHEDGFIRSIDLGVNGAASFSVVSDEVGIYYDATQKSELENLLNQAEFSAAELEQAQTAMNLITQYSISKYNHAPNAPHDYLSDKKSNVLVIAQTAGDASLKYGLGNQFSTQQILQSAIQENPQAHVYIKLHPDVLTGKKQSDISPVHIPKNCTVLTENYNPISLLKQVDKVYTKTSQMGFEALMLGKQVVCFGLPFYAGWGLTDDRVSCARRQTKRSVLEVFAAAYLRYTRYFNPYTKAACDIFEVISTIQQYKKRYIQAPEYGYFFGFSRWKHGYTRPFFDEIKPSNLFFINPLFSSHKNLSEKKGLLKNKSKSAIYIWGRRDFAEIEQIAKENAIPVYRVEDGFVRSVSLGSDLTRPYSLVVDSQGIYFDPTQSSDLEQLLNEYDFQTHSNLIQLAEQAKSYILDKKLSKYNVYEDVYLDFPANKKIILVPGQVADDASIQYGAQGMTNLALLQAVRNSNSEAHIVFKPHPDVLVGNRAGHIEPDEALQFCNQIVTKVGIDSVLVKADEVHTMTSLVGFEALMRGKKVVTYGLPFYAGWGLTEDRQVCSRRVRKLSLLELIAGTLLIYPRYISPQNKQLCDLASVFKGLEEEKRRLEHDWIYSFKVNLRNKVIRIILKLFKSKTA